MFFSYINLGCKVNQVETEQIAQGLTQKGYTFSKKIEESDLLIINTCTVTQKADRKSLQTIKKYNTFENLKNIFITGCYSELEKDLKKNLPKKNIIVSQKNKNNLPEIIDKIFKNKFGYFDHIPDYQNKWQAFKNSRIYTKNLMNDQTDFFTHKRSFLKIQDGCNAFCSYCRIPFARGGPVSRSFLDIVSQVKKLKKKSSEIVLTGINIGTYFDKEEKKTFGELVKAILEECGTAKLRISSLEPQSIKPDFLECVRHKNFIPHLHLPLQGISNRLLKDMNRRYSLKDFKDILDHLREINPYFSVSTDIIVGFPEESDKEFDEGIKFIKKCDFSKIHVFPFSYRSLSSIDEKKNQALVKSVEKNVIKKRVSYLNNLSESLILKQVEKLKSVRQRFVLEEKIDPLGKATYSKILPFNYPIKEYDFFKGTTEYYLKGILPIPKETKKAGEALSVITKNLAPVIFEVAL